MKEQEQIVILSEAKNLMPNGLTTRPFPPTLGRGGDIFAMDAGRPTEGPPRPTALTTETKGSGSLFPELSTAQLLQETGVNNIQNPAQLVAFVSKFREESRQAPSKNPFKDWTIDRLKKQYLAWHVNTSKIENQQKTFGEKEAVSGHAHPYSAALIEELERRQVDIRELFLESTKRAAEEGAEIRSIGAAKADIPLTDYANPVLQDIAREIQNEIDRVGESKPPDTAFAESVQENMARVRGLSDSTPGIPRDEVVRLLGTLNRLRAEYNAAARAEQIRAEQSSQRRYRSYWSEQEENDIDDPNPEKKEAREKIFEEIFIGADSSPGTEWNEAFSLEARSKWDNFISRVSKVPVEGENLTREFSARFEARKILHNANWGASGGGNIQVFAQAAGTYKDEYTDLIFQDPLVESALHFFEQGFQQIKADNNGQLPYAKLEWNFNRKVRNPDGTFVNKPGSDLEDMVHEQLRNAISQGVVKDRKGNTLRNLEPWRIQRAIVLARGFGVLSLRFPEIAAEARLPEQTVLSDANVHAHRTASIYGEAVGKYLDPLEHLIEKFGIGLEDRAILYFFLTGDKRKFASKAQLEVALRMRSQLRSGDQRVIDLINFFRTGGPFSHSSWRQRVSFEQLEGETDVHFEKRLERSGIGVLEARVEGDVDDQIRDEVRRSPEFVGKTDREIESSEKLSVDFDNAVKARSKEIQKRLLLEKRLDMWKNALKTNPLRVMWEWENKEREINKSPGQRIRFLAEALGVSQDVAKGLIGQVEKDLMIVQEDFVSLRKPIDENNENLDFDVIGRELEVDTIEERDRMIEQRTERRENARKYVEKIREKAAEGDYRFFKDVLLKYTSVTGDPGIDTPFPFVVGFDDIPFGEFDFMKSGGRGMSRKISDFASAANASTELIGLLNGIGTAQTIDPLIGHLVKIKEALSNVDSDLAQKLIEPLAEGVIRIYKKDPLAKLPLGIGTFIGMTGDTSFAQKHKGMGAMALDETDIYNLTKHLTQNSLVSIEKIEKLRWKIGGTLFHSGLDFTRTYGQLLLLVMIIEFAARTAKGK